MHSLTYISILCWSLSLTSAHPFAKRDGAISISADQLLKIMPGSASCSDPKECRTNKQAADPISKSFAKYGITTSNEAAALLGIMSMESVDLKYGKNQWPGRPGQGCYNMQMPPFNLEYAKSIKELQPQVEKLTAGHAPDNATYTSVLDLLLANDEYSLGAAAWYYSTKCTDDVKNGLKTGGDQGWSKYITACIQTEANDERKAPYKRALEALGKGNSAPAPASSSSKPYPPAAAPAPAPATAAPPAPISSAPTTTATPASSGSNGTGSGITGATGTTLSGSCSGKEGYWNCIDGATFQRCAAGSWSKAMGVAPGTTCQVGESESYVLTGQRGGEIRR